MNERIKALAKQARQIGEYVNYGQIRLSPGQFEQKFAELIVKECIKEIGYKSVELLDVDLFPHYQLRLKNHFGLQE